MTRSKRSNTVILTVIACIIASYMLFSYQTSIGGKGSSSLPTSVSAPQLSGLNDTLCIHTLPDNLVNQRGDMAIQIPPSLQLPEPMLACLYHRYVTTIQTLCIEPKLFGNPDADCGYICVDGDLLTKGDCRVAIFDRVVGDTYTNQMKIQRNCDIISFPTVNKTRNTSSFDQFLSDPRSARITLLVFSFECK